MYRTFIRMPQRLLLAAALAGLGTVAMAQGAALAPEAVASAPAAHQRFSPEQWHQRMAQRHAQHMADLKAALGIAPDQESAWSQFEAAMQPPEKPQPFGKPGEWAKLTTPERIDRMEQRMADRQQHFKQMGDAIKAFYGQLTPQQQKIFDERSMRFAEHKWHDRFGPRGGRGDGAAPHIRHHPQIVKPDAAASQAN